MAKKSASGLVAKLGAKARQAVEAHKADETKFSGGGDLPAGINAGVAQLTTCKFGIYEQGEFKGEYYFMASGIVVKPKTHEDIPIQGMRTQIGPEPICDTPKKSRKTIDDHMAWVLNELRKLGVDTSELDADDLETTAQALQEEKPYFRFRTWAGKPTKEYPDPRTNHDWSGAVEYEEGEEDSDDVEDNTESDGEETEEVEEAEEVEGEVEQDWDELAKAADNEDEESAAILNEKALEIGMTEKEINATSTWKVIAKKIKEALESSEEESSEEETEEEASEESEEASDFEALGAAADEGDENAATELNRLAEAAGVDPNDYGTWAEAAEAIMIATSEASEGEEVETEEESEESVDYEVVGASADEGDEDAAATMNAASESAGLDPNDYGTWAELGTALNEAFVGEGEEESSTPTIGSVWTYKPPTAKKPIEVEVVQVGKESANVKSLDDGKTIYKSVPFDKLSAT